MGLFISIFILLLAIIGLYILFKALQWVFKRQLRVIGVFIVITSFIVCATVYQQFFVKMEFVQSEVYPDLYLIKYPIDDDTILYNSIKDKVTELFDELNITNDISLIQQPFTLRFYEYNTGDWGESGTVYFLKHKERRDGITAELLEYYPEYELAKFMLQPCNENEPRHMGLLKYYKNHKLIKTDTIIKSYAKATKQ